MGRAGALRAADARALTQPSLKLRSLEAGRGLAALAVVAFHATGIVALPRYFGNDALWSAFRWGDAGVDFFFVLSGFVIAVAHADDVGRRAAVGSYLARRVRRIFPTYWLVFAAVWASAAAVPQLRASVPWDATTLLRALLLVPQNPAVVGSTGAPVLVVAWSLQYEMLFYVLFATFIASRRFGVACCLAVVAWLAWGPTPAWLLAFATSPHVPQFAFGLIAAALFRRDAIGWPRAVLVTGAAAFALLATLAATGHGLTEPWRAAGFGIASAMIVLGAAAAERARLIRVPPALAALGAASYALYLLHFPLMSLLCKAMAHVHADAWLPAPALPILLAALSVVAAVAFHRVVERPLLALGSGTNGRRTVIRP